jgi:OmpA-OmpF porin, OOP family
MALFDALIDDVAGRFGLGSNAAPLVREALALIVRREGGIAGFLELFKRVGLGSIAASWLGQANPAPLPTGDIEKALVAPAIDPIAHRLGIGLPAVYSALAYALPKLVGLLTPHGVVPAAPPAEVAAFLGPLAGSITSGDVHAHGAEVKQIRARSFAPAWLWPLVAVAAVAGLGWAVWPILFPGQPPEATTTRAAAPAPAPAPTAAEAAKPAPAPTVPSTLSVANDNGLAVVSGLVHDDKTRGSILDALKGAFGADKVKADIALDANRADGPWLPNFRAALEALKIPGAKATFEGGSVNVGGSIVDADREKITASLKSALGGGVTLGAIADAFAGAEASAYAKAATALGSLKAGFSGDDLVAALNQAAIDFPYGEAELPASVQSLLGKIAATMKQLPPGYALEIAGYTDSAGDPNVEGPLTQKRAEAVRDALVKAGVPSDMLVAKGYGAASPIAGNDTEEGRLRNRRIEFHVLKTPAEAAAAPPAQSSMPSTLSIDDEASIAKVSGAVHDHETRGLILDALRAVFGAGNVEGDVTVDPTRAAAPWLAHLREALEALKVPGLQAMFEGGAIKLGGPIPEAERQKVAASLKSVFGDGLTIGGLGGAAAAASTAAAAAPSTLSIDDVSGVANVSGAVPDEETRRSILDALRSVFGADAVKGDLTVDAGRAAAPWLAHLREALDALKVPGLKTAFDGASVKLGGTIPEAEREKVAASLGSALGAGVTVGSLIPSLGERASSANEKAAAALGALKTGFSAADVATALNLSVVNFASDSAEVPDSDLRFLRTAAASLKALPPGYAIEVAGYTDSTGDPAGNLVLSRERAESVRDVLVKSGAPEDMLTARGYGAANPIDSNDTEEGRWRNRRIQYHVTRTP